MKHYGIDGLAHKLIKSYLENRKQYVEFNNKCSEMKNIKNEVPQFKAAFWDHSYF